MAEQSSEDLWTIVISSGKYFIGKLTNLPMSDEMVTMQPCYEVTSQLIPVGRGEGGRPIMSKNISAEPILVCFEGPPVRIRADVIIHAEDMKEGDRSRYKRLTDTAAKVCSEARMADSGLVGASGGRLG